MLSATAHILATFPHDTYCTSPCSQYISVARTFRPCKRHKPRTSSRIVSALPTALAYSHGWSWDDNRGVLYSGAMRKRYSCNHHRINRHTNAQRDPRVLTVHNHRPSYYDWKNATEVRIIFTNLRAWATSRKESRQRKSRTLTAITTLLSKLVLHTNERQNAELKPMEYPFVS